MRAALVPAIGETVAWRSGRCAFEQAMGFHLAKVIAELGDGISVGGQAEAGENGLVDIAGAL